MERKEGNGRKQQSVVAGEGVKTKSRKTAKMENNMTDGGKKDQSTIEAVSMERWKERNERETTSTKNTKTQTQR